MSASRIYTKLGDDGSTGLLFGGRTSKGSLLMDAVGSVDETVAALGTARAELTRLQAMPPAVDPATGLVADPAAGSASGSGSGSDSELDSGTDSELAADILAVQRDLFVVGADLVASPHGRHQLVPGVSLVTPEMVSRLESKIDQLMAAKPLRPVFVVPGANPVSAALDIARATVRRAERRLVGYWADCPRGAVVNEQAAVYLNRVSDLLYVLARHAAGPAEEPASHGPID